MISSGHYLASLIGLRMLQQGGNAVDAGVAAGIAINVLQTDMTSLGGVAPIMIYLAETDEVLTISGLGWWPRAATLENVTRLGQGGMPLGHLFAGFLTHYMSAPWVLRLMLGTLLVLMPFFAEQTRCVASTHLCSGTLERSNTVPTVAVNWSRQALHWYTPGRWALP